PELQRQHPGPQRPEPRPGRRGGATIPRRAVSMEPLEKHDIQGLVLKGYGRMAATRYAVLRIDDPARAKVWLARVSGEVSDGDHRARGTGLNLAFGYPRLKEHGLTTVQ